MWLLVEVNPPRFPLLDCELASLMIRLVGRRPRRNVSVRTESRMRAFVGLSALTLLGVMLTVLVFSW